MRKRQGAPKTALGTSVVHGGEDVRTRSSRAHSGTTPLLFRKTPQDIVRARACYEDMVKEGLSMGMPPYRIGIDYMGLVWPKGAQAQMWQTLQKALDPQGIIAPGRYLPPLNP